MLVFAWSRSMLRSLVRIEEPERDEVVITTAVVVFWPTWCFVDLHASHRAREEEVDRRARGGRRSGWGGGQWASLRWPYEWAGERSAEANGLGAQGGCRVVGTRDKEEEPKKARSWWLNLHADPEMTQRRGHGQGRACCRGGRGWAGGHGHAMVDLGGGWACIYRENY